MAGSILVTLFTSVYSHQNDQTSYEQLKNAYNKGMSAAINLDLSVCKIYPSQELPYHGKNHSFVFPYQESDSYQLTTRFNIEKANLRGSGESEALYIYDSYRLPPSPERNATTIGSLYDIAINIQLYASEEVHYLIKWVRIDQSESIDAIYHCPWSSLTINIKD